MLKKMICAAVCACLLLTCLPFVSTAASGNWYTHIGDVRMSGGAYLDALDFSAVIGDRGTVTDKTLHLCRVYDAGTSYESCDRVANFVFDVSRPGVAVLDDYPGAEAKIEPGDYILQAVDGCLFDDTEVFRFSAADYYKNVYPNANPGLRPVRVGLPAFDGYRITKAQGETVYEIQMTLSEELAAFYDTLHPDVPLQIDCKYGYGSDEVFAVLDARAAAYDPVSGVLTVELLNENGDVGTNMHDFRISEESYGYVFEFEYPAGLFSCGGAKSAYAFRQISGRAIENMPARIFTETNAGRLYSRLNGKLWSEKPYRRAFAFTALWMLAPYFFTNLTRETLRSVSAFDRNTADAAREVIRQTLQKYYSR